ncbi:MAG: ATP-binding cassette domain-containing protein [Rhodospirillales bacterium]|nr:ATP-binding cassette domain-containing protein [Rhodospirillales bacterium]
MNGSENGTETRQPILSIRGGGKRFGGNQALDDINLDIYDNEVLALLGDNGAGKSTLIKAISGAHTLDDGEMLFEGKPVEIQRPEDAHKLGIKTVYQDLALFGILNVTSNIFADSEYTRWGFLQKKKMDQEAQKVLSHLKTTIKSLNQEVRSLSGGQQHSVAIGRGVFIGHDPRLIIMDEPTAGLGVKQSREVLRLLKELGEKYAVIFITHNLEYAFEVAKRAVVLCSGRIVGQLDMADADHSHIVSLMMGIEQAA